MRNIVVLGFFLITFISGQAQESEVRTVSAFKGVRSSEAIDVYLKKGDNESVKVEVSGVSLSSVITEVSGTYLKIHMASGNYRNKKSVKVYVTYVTLEKISSSSASNVFSEDQIKSKSMEISASSAASIEIKIESDNISVEASSAGNVVLEGKAKSISVEASSAGDINAYNLEAETVRVSVSSGGTAKVNVTKNLTADASSGGNVRYRGNPTNTITNSSSGGSVKKSN
jgi:Putative auto-transporter adhesin, head GIN domain